MRISPYWFEAMIAELRDLGFPQALQFSPTQRMSGAAGTADVRYGSKAVITSLPGSGHHHQAFGCAPVLSSGFGD